MRRVGPRPSDLIQEELIQERQELLRDLLESRGWAEVLLPSLRLKMARIAQTLAVDASRTLEETRVKQGEYRALAQIAGLTVNDTSLLFSEE